MSSCSGICLRCSRESFHCSIDPVLPTMTGVKSLWTRASLNSSTIGYQAPGWAFKGLWSTSTGPMWPCFAKDDFYCSKMTYIPPSPSLCLGGRIQGYRNYFYSSGLASSHLVQAISFLSKAKWLSGDRLWLQWVSPLPQVEFTSVSRLIFTEWAYTAPWVATTARWWAAIWIQLLWSRGLAFKARGLAFKARELAVKAQGGPPLSKKEMLRIK